MATRLRPLHGMVRDLRYALRGFVRAPLFAVLVAVTLAIGIGPTTAMFSIVDSLLLRDLPYRDADSLVVVWRLRQAGDRAPVSGPDFDDFRRRNHSFSDLAAASWSGSYNLGDVPRPVRVEGAEVTPRFFALLGVRPLLGQLPLYEDGSVVLSHSLWLESFGGRRNVIGRDARFNGRGYRIAAVMPPDFAYPERAQLWIPRALTPDRLGHRAMHQFRVIGRLRADVTLAQASADFEQIAKQLGDEYPDTTRGIGVSLLRLRDSQVGDVRRSLFVLFGAVGFLLLIACSNAANLLLTRAAGRQRELAIRGALGATQFRIARQLLTESVLLSLAGGAIGLAIAFGSIRLVRLYGATWFARPELISIDARVLVFNFALAVATGIFFGFAPLLGSSDLFAPLRSAVRGDPRHRLVREAIVVAVVAFSFFLLIGAGLLMRSFLRARSVNVGVSTQDLLTMRIYLPEAKYPDSAVRTAFYRQLTERLDAADGIDAAAAISGLPLENTMSGDIAFPGEGAFDGSRRIASFSEVSPGWLAVARVPLLEGRDFTGDDLTHLAPTLEALAAGRDTPWAPILINETLARRFWPSRTALGERILVGGDFPGRVVGVVGDVLQRGATEPVPPHVYLPLGSPLPLRAMNVAVRSSLPRAALVSVVRAQLQALDRDVPPYRIRTMEEVLAESVAGSRFQAVILAIFAAIALTLATIGIYGVISYGVAQRTREMGIRMAAGATTTDLLRLVLGRVVMLAVVGIAIGVAGALLLTRWLESLLFQVSAADPRAFAAVAVLLLVTAILASARPAHRAAAVDPATSLRYD